MRVVVCTIVHHPADARIYHRQIRALVHAMGGHCILDPELFRVQALQGRR